MGHFALLSLRYLKKYFFRKRQHGFSKNDVNSTLFKFYRNVVNRERKKCKAKYYEYKVRQMKGENPKLWRKEIKRTGGVSSMTGDVVNQLNVDSIESLFRQEKANSSNKAFLEPLEEYRFTSPPLPLLGRTFSRIQEFSVPGKSLPPSIKAESI